MINGGCEDWYYYCITLFYEKNTKSYELLSHTIKLLNKQTVIKWRIIRYDQTLEPNVDLKFRYYILSMYEILQSKKSNGLMTISYANGF